jgi:hypothetical protein
MKAKKEWKKPELQCLNISNTLNNRPGTGGDGSPGYSGFSD